MSDDPEWFARKRYGYGSGTPISWQGWAVTIAFGAMVLAACLFLLPYSRLAFVSTIATVTIAFMVIAAKTTRGGWRWRRGDED